MRDYLEYSRLLQGSGDSLLEQLMVSSSSSGSGSDQIGHVGSEFGSGSWMGSSQFPPSSG